MRKPFEPINDGKETERFVDAVRRIVAVPKKEIDKRIEAERRAKEVAKDTKRKT